MAKCKYETSNGRCGLKGSYAYRYKCFTTDLCKCHEPITNADRIRAMTDEELADLLTNCSNNYGYGWVTEAGKAICYENNIKWLKHPAEG